VSEVALNGHDPMMLAVTTPGVLLGTKSSMIRISPGNDFVGAGTREIQNSMSLDGISIMNNLITTPPTRPMVETVQEVEVQTGTYSAQYEAYMGVHINMVTKGGTNQFHGNIVELRDQSAQVSPIYRYGSFIKSRIAANRGSDLTTTNRGSLFSHNSELRSSVALRSHLSALSRSPNPA
jgi:hypothetical protein